MKPVSNYHKLSSVLNVIIGSLNWQNNKHSLSIKSIKHYYHVLNVNHCILCIMHILYRSSVRKVEILPAKGPDRIEVSESGLLQHYWYAMFSTTIIQQIFMFKTLCKIFLLKIFWVLYDDSTRIQLLFTCVENILCLIFVAL